VGIDLFNIHVPCEVNLKRRKLQIEKYFVLKIDYMERCAESKPKGKTLNVVWYSSKLILTAHHVSQVS